MKADSTSKAYACVTRYKEHCVRNCNSCESNTAIENLRLGRAVLRRGLLTLLRIIRGSAECSFSRWVGDYAKVDQRFAPGDDAAYFRVIAADPAGMRGNRANILPVSPASEEQKGFYSTDSRLLANRRTAVHHRAPRRRSCVPLACFFPSLHRSSLRPFFLARVAFPLVPATGPFLEVDRAAQLSRRNTR